MILVIDNYDSFTYNIVQYLRELGATVEVHRNDAIDIAGIAAKAPKGLLISPGPGTPDDAGISLAAIEAFAGTLPMLGVCLGHQSIAAHYGAKVVRAGRLMHGRTSPIEHKSQGVFSGLPSPFTATRYHSLIVDPQTLPDCLVPTAFTAEGELMGLRHREHAIEGVQFHPESFLTEHGHAMLANWLRECGINPTQTAAPQ